MIEKWIIIQILRTFIPDFGQTKGVHHQNGNFELKHSSFEK